MTKRAKSQSCGFIEMYNHPPIVGVPAQKRKEKEPDLSPNLANKNSWLWELRRPSNMSEAEMAEWESEGKYLYLLLNQYVDLRFQAIGCSGPERKRRWIVFKNKWRSNSPSSSAA
jgi:hypothetical protein